MNSQNNNYKIAARDIVEELEQREFSAKTSDDVIGLEDTIYDIIKENIEGNVNYGVDTTGKPDIRVSPLTGEELRILIQSLCEEENGDGWEDDLQNQG